MTRMLISATSGQPLAEADALLIEHRIGGVPVVDNGRLVGVLSRSDIIDQVWDWAFDGSPRIVDVYVRSLREAMGEGPERPVIRTVRGAGYALCRRADAGRDDVPS